MRTFGYAVPLGEVGEKIILNILLFVVYVLTAMAGIYMFNGVPTAPAFLWAPSGIALAALMLEGFSIWPAIAAAAFVASFLSGQPLLAAFGVAVSRTIEPLVGAYLLRRFRFDPGLSRLQDTVLLIGVAAICSLIVPLLGTTSIWMFGKVSTLAPTSQWLAAWCGELLSLLLIVPLILKWFSRDAVAITRDELAETGAAFATVIAVALFLFWTPVRSIGGFPTVYFILLPFFWIALRLKPYWVPVALMVTAVIGATGVIFANVLPENTSIGMQLFNLEVFLMVITAMFLVIASIVEERRQSVTTLELSVQNLEKALTKIQAEDRTKSEFIAILGHELRNPLAPLLSTIELMKLIKQSDEEKALLLSMQDRVETIVRLIDDLLDVSRITRNKLILKKEHIDIIPIIEKSATSVTQLVASKGHELVIRMPDEKIYLLADPVRIEQSIVNLLNNSARYTENGGRIYLSADRDRDKLVVRVTDTGIGLNSDMLEVIFEPFKQANRGHTGGLGIGLAVTKNLIEMHGGSIKAESDGIGKGSEFTVLLPIA